MKAQALHKTTSHTVPAIHDVLSALHVHPRPSSEPAAMTRLALEDIAVQRAPVAQGLQLGVGVLRPNFFHIHRISSGILLLVHDFEEVGAACGEA